MLEKNKSVPEKILDVDLKGYTLVDISQERKLDLSTSAALGHRRMEQATAWQKQGKAYWLVDRNEQIYKQKPARIDPQIEFMYEELGLSQNMEITVLSPQKQQQAPG